MAFLSQEKVAKLGLKYVGKDVQISDKASIYNPNNISIGDYSRIDDFCILSAGLGGISVGRYVHIACLSYMIGKGAIVLEDFSGISGRVAIYSSNDDYSGAALTNPTVLEQYRNATYGDVVLRKHSLVGAGAIILPSVEVGVGAVVAAMALVKHDCMEFSVNAGIPAKKIGNRKEDLLELEKEFLASTNCDT